MNKLIAVFCIATISLYPLFSEATPPGGNPRPNIVLIIADDVRYNSFKPTGGPSWFDAPAIERIAEEGANFHNFYTVYSLCVPARSAIFSGLYPHLNGCLDNSLDLPKDILTLSEVLDSFGYNNAMAGKYHISKSAPQPGWKYWFTTSGTIEYTNPTMNYNGVTSTYFGNMTDIVTDTSSAWLHRIDTPFFVCIGHLAPHKPVTPQAIYADVYDDEIMPIPPNFYPFVKCFPSFLYDSEDEYYQDSAKAIFDLTKYFEGMKGVDDNVDSVFSILTQRGMLENTMIIFIGDNGAMYGDHLLDGKGLPYEPSMKLPMFIRYPKWFPEHEDFYNEDFFSLNTDIMPSIVDAAGISLQTIDVQGFTLRKLAKGDIHRDKFMFEKIKVDPVDQAQTSEDDITPSLRTIRTLNYKFTRYHCDHIVEEFFDLDIDSLETTNRIKYPAYQGVIESLRKTLDSMQVELEDTIETTIDTVYRPCRLLKFNKKILVPDDTIIFKLNPNPATDEITVSIIPESDEDVQLSVFSQLGQLMFRRDLHVSKAEMTTEITLNEFPQGIYFVEVRQGAGASRQTVLKQ